jgi:branched-chain amino acid transport system substrate-binding protein
MRKSLSGTRARVLGTGVAAVAVIGLAAASAIGATGNTNAKSINVGNITAVTNLGGTFTGFQSGVKAFFSYYNAHGGVDGYHVNLTSLDDAGDPGKNASEARQLVAQNKVLAIVGEASIADAGSQKYLQGKGVPVIGGWAASSTWHRPATNMFVSLEGPNTPYCPIWSSDQAKRRGIKKIAFVAQDFPSAIQDAVCRSTAAKFQGVGMAGSIIKASLTAVDYRSLMQTAMSSGADAVYFSTGLDGILKGIQAGEQLGFKGTYIATQFGAALFTGLKSAGLDKAVSGRLISAAFSLLPTDPSSTSPELAKAKAGIAKYAPTYTSDVTALSGWAAGKLFADALTAAGADPKAMMAWISKQKAYRFGGLQGPFNYTTGSKPNQCLTELQWLNGKVTRDVKTAPAPKFNCGPLIAYTGKKVLAPAPKG